MFFVRRNSQAGGALLLSSLLFMSTVQTTQTDAEETPEFLFFSLQSMQCQGSPMDYFFKICKQNCETGSGAASLLCFDNVGMTAYMWWQRIITQDISPAIWSNMKTSLARAHNTTHTYTHYLEEYDDSNK